jgi:predicted DNA-binding transcriptional regulator YafY
MTAEQLSQELEVSVRTIYRDLDALSAAGIPVYTERGPGGGCALMDHYRTNLTGMTEEELRALFMLSIPTPLAKLGFYQELKTALLKLSAALPASQQDKEMQVRQRIHLDSSWWFQSEEPTPFLPELHQAVWEDRKLLLTYKLRFRGELERIIEPYGLVAKAGIWYLVFKRDERFRILRISQIMNAQATDETFQRPRGFNLEACWEICCEDYEKNRPVYPVRMCIAPNFVPYLPLYFGDPIREQIENASKHNDQGWIELTLSFETLEQARDRILDFGRAVEVIEPEALRLSIIDFASQIFDFYKAKSKGDPTNEGYFTQPITF